MIDEKEENADLHAFDPNALDLAPGARIFASTSNLQAFNVQAFFRTRYGVSTSPIPERFFNNFLHQVFFLFKVSLNQVEVSTGVTNREVLT